MGHRQVRLWDSQRVRREALTQAATRLTTPQDRSWVVSKSRTLNPGPFQWTCGDEQLDIVLDSSILALFFDAQHGMAVTFPLLKRKMFAALLKRQYGRLQCLASVGPMFRVCEACVPPEGAYGCEIWGCQQLPQQYSAQRHELLTSYLQMLKEITGVKGCTSTDILLAELGLKSLRHVWLLRAAKF